MFAVYSARVMWDAECVYYSPLIALLLYLCARGGIRQERPAAT